MVPLAALLFIPCLGLAACKLAKPNPLILVMITAHAALPTHPPAWLAVGLIWICKLANPNLLMLIRYIRTQAALLCSIDKVLRAELGLRVTIHLLTHSIDTIPAHPGVRTHWLRNGDGVKTSRH